MKTHLLFICTANQQRSPTAEYLFESHEQYEAKSAGTHPLAEVQVRSYSIEWADIIFCMEENHKQFLLANFPLAKKKKIIVLDVPNIFYKNDLNLKQILKKKLSKNNIQITEDE